MKHVSVCDAGLRPATTTRLPTACGLLVGWQRVSLQSDTATCHDTVRYDRSMGLSIPGTDCADDPVHSLVHSLPSHCDTEEVMRSL